MEMDSMKILRWNSNLTTTYFVALTVGISMKKLLDNPDKELILDFFAVPK